MCTQTEKKELLPRTFFDNMAHPTENEKKTYKLTTRE